MPQPGEPSQSKKNATHIRRVHGIAWSKLFWAKLGRRAKAMKKKPIKHGAFDDLPTPFTREGSQVQSLSRPPRKALYFKRLYPERRSRHHTERHMNARLVSGQVPGDLFHV